MSHRALTRKPILGQSQSRPGGINGNAKPVIVDGKRYGCIKDAALEIGCHPETLCKKFRQYRETNDWPQGWSEQ